MRTELGLSAMGLVLPPPHKYSKPNRTGCVRVGNLLYVSGHMPAAGEGIHVTGKVTDDVSEEDAYRSARSAGLSMLTSIKQVIGDLDKVKRVVKIAGMVNASPGFVRNFAVIDGASDLFLELWGPEYGQHARSTFGIFEASGNITCEIDGIFEVESLV